jgi:hypothetical protein
VGALWNECVVPFTVEVVATQCAPFAAFHLLVGDLDALGVVAVPSSACTVSSVREVVAAMVLTMTSWLSSGRPRQFIEMCENSRCSILFHLDVSGRQVADGDAEGGLVGEVASFGIAAAVDDEAGPSPRRGRAQPVATRQAQWRSPARRNRGSAFAAGTSAMSYSFGASMAFLTSCACPTCCAV